MIWQNLSRIDIEKLNHSSIKTLLQGALEAYDISPEFHRQTHALRFSDPDIKRIYDRERKREIDQIQFLIEKNKESFTKGIDSKATAMVIHNAVENVAHTIKFLGTEIEEERLVDALTEMISGLLDSRPGK
jgi:hypothetical protein